MVLRAPAQPMPVSPSPWRKMRVAVCFLADLSTTGGTPTFMLTADGWRDRAVICNTQFC